MAFDYLPILAEHAAPRPPRKLYRAPRIGWQPLGRPLNEMRVSLVTSAAIRQTRQRAFTAGGDASHRRIVADPGHRGHRRPSLSRRQGRAQGCRSGLPQAGVAGAGAKGSRR